ncbi:hypothetical protein KPL74_01950 [Bacillus sp. NP157]|nr:hypothetical protein KPL74_01950 [Bacillus sp. NP157]
MKTTHITRSALAAAMSHGRIERQGRAAALHRGGHGFAEIGEELETSPGVAGRLVRAGKSRRHQALVEAQKAHEERQADRQALRLAKALETQTAMAFRRAGLTWTAVAERTGWPAVHRARQAMQAEKKARLTK